MTYAPLFPTTEADLWRTQRETLADLLAFVDEHAPHTSSPLPVVDWRIGAYRTVFSELTRFSTAPGGFRKDLPGVIAAYAAALGVEVKTEHFSGKTRYHATGRIGRREGAAREPRATLHISADVWDDDDQDDERDVVIGAGSPETSALTRCPTCGSPEWLPDGRRGWNPVDVECEVCAGTYEDQDEG